MWKRPTSTQLLLAICLCVGCQALKLKVEPIQTPPPIPDVRDFLVVIGPIPQASSNLLAQLAQCMNTNGMTDFSRSNIFALIREHCPPPPLPVIPLTLVLSNGTARALMQSTDLVHWQTNCLLPPRPNTNQNWTVKLDNPATNRAMFWRVK